MSETVLLSLIGVVGAIVGGVAPVLVTMLAGWRERRSIHAERKRLLEEGQKRIEFLDSWYALQLKILGEDQLEDARRFASQELNQLRDGIFARGAHAPPASRLLRDRSLLRRALLAYKPRKPLGWFYHLLFYAYLGAMSAMLVALYVEGEALSGIDESGAFSYSYLLGEWIAAALFLCPSLLLWWLATRSERRAEEALKSEPAGP